MTSQELELSLQNPATSRWLLNAMKEMKERDPLDAARDADRLVFYCKTRLKEVEEANEIMDFVRKRMRLWTL